MRKVVFLVVTLSTGGAERVVSNLSIGISNDIQREIILYSNKVSYPYKGDLKVLKKYKGNNVFVRIRNILYRCAQIKNIKKTNPNFPVISFLESPNFINLLTRRHGKTIVSVRNYMSIKHQSGLRSFFWNLFIKKYYKKADRIVAVSKEIKNDLHNNYKIPKEKIKVIYNSYSIESINELANQNLKEDYEYIFNAPVILTTGRLNKQKGQWHLLRAFKKVKKEMPKAKLVVLGEGKLLDYLKELATDLKVRSDVHFLGFKKNPFKYIKKSTVFVLSSLNEGFPNALVEAMACGKPVVSTDCLSGPREILAPQEFNISDVNYRTDISRYGILLPVCDGKKYTAFDELTNEEEIMANSLIHLLRHDNLRDHFSKKSLERAKSFDKNKIIENWEDLILS